MDIGPRVRAVRTERGLSQEALARQADVSLNVITRLERGVITDPHYSTISAIAEALGTTVTALLEEPELAGKASARRGPGSLERMAWRVARTLLDANLVAAAADEEDLVEIIGAVLEHENEPS
jgi:transcriptional regulator with XRE-family HTH domain